MLDQEGGVESARADDACQTGLVVWASQRTHDLLCGIDGAGAARAGGRAAEARHRRRSALRRWALCGGRERVEERGERERCAAMRREQGAVWRWEGKSRVGVQRRSKRGVTRPP
jgi:hypothetical protein